MNTFANAFEQNLCKSTKGNHEENHPLQLSCGLLVIQIPLSIAKALIDAVCYYFSKSVTCDQYVSHTSGDELPFSQIVASNQG